MLVPTHLEADAGVNMKSLPILLLLFAASQAIHLKEFGPKNPVINEGEDLQLFCETAQKWNQCEFYHESNDKSCKFWMEGEKLVPKQDCVGVGMTVGDEQFNPKKCVVKIQKVDNEDAGQWTCKMTIKKWDSDERHFQVSVTKKPGQVKNTNETSMDSIRFVRNSILAFTFLITGIFVAGCVVLLPKSWPLLRSQCTWN